MSLAWSGNMVLSFYFLSIWFPPNIEACISKGRYPVTYGWCKDKSWTPDCLSPHHHFLIKILEGGTMVCITLHLQTLVQSLAFSACPRNVEWTHDWLTLCFLSTHKKLIKTLMWVSRYISCVYITMYMSRHHLLVSTSSRIQYCPLFPRHDSLANL